MTPPLIRRGKPSTLSTLKSIINQITPQCLQLRQRRKSKCILFSLAPAARELGEVRIARVFKMKWLNLKCRYLVSVGMLGVFEWLLLNWISEKQIQYIQHHRFSKWVLMFKLFRTTNGQVGQKHLSTHLCEVFARLALILVAAGVEVARDGRDAQVQLAILDKNVFKVVAPHGPGLHQDVMHLHCSRKGLVGLLWPGDRRIQQGAAEWEGRKANNSF